ncbi:MAG TPA: hypothetical protein VE091_08520 [Gemmatimonadales bacterium]|nr:hypothetical protein [Gemmatimonadales bacterium]
MAHETALITTVAAGFGMALLFGLAATRLRLPALVGYLLAGVAVGPSTPGFVADVLGVSLGLLAPEARSLVLAGALLSITLNPVLFGAIDPLDRWLGRRRARRASRAAVGETR